MVNIQLDTKEFWEALTTSGKAKALRAIECHPRFCTSDWAALPALMKRRLEELWHDHPTIEINPVLHRKKQQ